MHFISHVHFFSFLCYGFLAVRILLQSPRQTKNFIAGISILCFALWSFSFVFIHHHATPLSHAIVWLDISSIGGLLYPAILLWFSLHLIGWKTGILSWSTTAFGLILVVLQFSSHSIAEIAGPNTSGPGWNVRFLESIPNQIYGAYALIVALTALVLPMIVAADKRRQRLERERSVLVLSGAFLSIGLGIAYEQFAAHMGWSDGLFFDSLPLPCAITLYIAVKKYRLFGPTLDSAYKGIVGSMDEAVILTDLRGRITYSNNAANRLFDKIKPLTHRNISSVLSNAESSSAKSLFGPDDYHKRWIVLKTNDNGHIDMLVSRTSPGETVGGWCYLLSDITQHANARRELERTERLRALEIFAGGIAHDLNNILTGIAGYLDLATLDDNSEQERREFLIKARDTFPNMVSLTGRLLTFSKWGYKTSGPTMPAPVLREAAELALSGSAVSLICDFDDDIRPVDMDQGQLTQIVNNLVVNARQALGNTGTVRISARNASSPDTLSTTPRNRVRITVEDNGPGMEETVRKRIFEPFFTTKNDGSGLGLATSHSIIEKQGGSIEVLSRPGEGTKFVLHLVSAENIEPAESSTVQPKAINHIENEKVLVLDDESGIRMLVTDMLEAVSCRVVAVPDGNAAIAAAKSAVEEDDPFTLGILDLTIPGGNGALDIAPILKATNPDIALVLSTGYSNKSLSEFENSDIFAAVLNKPYNFRDVKRLLQKMRELRHSTA